MVGVWEEGACKPEQRRDPLGNGAEGGQEGGVRLHMLHLWELLLLLGGKGQPSHRFHLRHDLWWHLTGARLFQDHKGRQISWLFPCCNTMAETVVCEPFGASHNAVAETHDCG